MRRTAPLLVALAALAAAAPAPAASTSTNWAGYAASGRGARFARVSAAWTVPAVDCTAQRRTYSSNWIGLGGYHTNARALEQAGTDANCDAAGGAHYSAWYELVPAASVRLPITVRAGDRIASSVRVGGRVVVVTVADRTTGARATRTLRASAIDVSAAEWIVEAPSACWTQGCTVLPLADFGTTGFTSARATSASGHTGAIDDPAWSASSIRLSSASRRDLGPGRFASDRAAATATPAALAAAGDAFAVTYAGADSSTGTGPGGV
jgi:hypothetical protein